MSKYLKHVLNSDLFNTPWPVFIDEFLIDGTKVKINNTCKNCKDHGCIKASDMKFICDNQLVSYSKFSGKTKITVFGFKDTPQSKKSNYKEFPLKSYNEWISKVMSLNEFIEDESLQSMSDTLHLFHDSIKWAEQIRISSEKIIDNKIGDSFGEKFSSSSNEIKSIYKSASLLTDSFKTIEVYFNPESASFGQTRKTNIYKLFDKVQSIIFNAEGSSRNKRFHLKGQSHKQIYLYESFPIVSLSLVYNALKYSTDRDIDIKIEDTNEGVSVSVTSVGPYMDSNEIVHIFDNGFRGKYAKKMHHDGMGIGLYVASEIAKIHGFKINVKSKKLNYSKENIDIAENIFSFEVNGKGV